VPKKRAFNITEAPPTDHEVHRIDSKGARPNESREHTQGDPTVLCSQQAEQPKAKPYWQVLRH
jgi:hypothetical protein